MPAERITANDEERRRQGFEIRTVFEWPLRDAGRRDVRQAEVVDDDRRDREADLRSGDHDPPLQRGPAAPRSQEG